jgi:hypothetical protein
MATDYFSDAELDSLRRVESGKDPYAVNKESKAMGAYQFLPETVQMLHKQGIKFNPFDENEARGAAKTYLNQLAERYGGDKQKALATYGGHITKDPSSYVNKVMGGASKTTDQFDLLGVTASQPKESKVTDQFDLLSGSAQPSAPIAEPTAQPAQAQKPVITSPMDVVKTFATPATSVLPKSVTEPIVGGAEALATLAMGAVAPWTGTIYGIYKNIKEGTNFRADRPENAQAVTYQPRTEKGQQYVEKVAEAMPEELQKVPLYVPGASTVGALAKPSAVQAGAKVSKVAQPIVKRFEELKANAPKVAEAKPVIVKPGEKVVETPNVTKPTAEKPFVEYNYSKDGNVPDTEQASRSDVLKRIGLQEARESSVLGNGKQAANEYTTSNLLTPEGDFYKQQFANERNALEGQARRIAEKTGGTFGLDEQSLYNRGQSIATPFDEYKKLLETEMKNNYQLADTKAAGKPAVNLGEFKDVLDKSSNFSVNDSFKSLKSGLIDHLKEEGIMDKAGNMRPITVREAENIRVYLNSNWNHERSGLINKIGQAIDGDVTKVAGENLYRQARDARIKIARVLDDPKGVAKVMDYDPKNPMNRAVAFEKIADTVEKMSYDQQAHLIKTLKEMPESLQPQAQQAINEIKAHIANKIYQEGSKTQGQWNAKNVTEYLNKNSKKMRLLTEDKEIAQMISDLNAAGHILKHDQGYKGSAVQTHNLVKLGAVPALTAIGGTIGGAVGSAVGMPIIGATVGSGIGGAKGLKIAEQASLKGAKKRMINLNEQSGKNKITDFGLKP